DGEGLRRAGRRRRARRPRGAAGGGQRQRKGQEDAHCHRANSLKSRPDLSAVLGPVGEESGPILRRGPMRKTFYFQAIALAAVVAAAAGCSRADSAPAAPAPSQAYFPVQRCINLANALNAPNEGDWGYRIEAEHL